ncbi:MAG: hypothetical protein KDA58_16165, partial [Planctomycetaceae bacterium]|nr:hypothetical protein [Planctomycetaceae bacterium]
QITEELREAAYFDEVRLYAVDHPADVEVFTNEKVGPPSIAEPMLHTARQLRSPVAAINQHGRDLLPEIAERDDRFARPYDQRVAHGLTEPTSIELTLDLADLPANATPNIKLFMTGWLYAPDPSVSVAIHESLTHGGSSWEVPQPLSLWVPNATGDWEPAIPFTGFVGGKTKTIVLDIGAVVNRDDPRIQLRSTMEFAWDQIAYTLNEPALPLTMQPLTLTSADLHYRGFSQRIEHPHFGAERYDYQTVSTAPRYTAMQGRFTRYGDVAALLSATDDHLIVMGAGDELTLDFDALPEPPAGMVRDFVIYNVGWDKDAQMQTVHGQSSEPLPFQQMTAYPSPEPREVDDAYEQYLQEYQTRRMTGSGFRRELVP